MHKNTFFGNGFTDFFKEHFDFTKMSNIKKVLYITVIAVVSYIIFYFIYSFIKFSNSAISHVFDFANWVVTTLLNNAKSCTGCDDIRDSKNNLETPQQACPPNGTPFFNKNCMYGFLGPLLVGLLGVIAYKFARDKLRGKSDLQKSVESASGKKFEDFIKDINERMEKLKDLVKESDPKTKDAIVTSISAIDAVINDPSLRENKSVLQIIRDKVISISKSFKTNIYTYINKKLNPLLKTQNIQEIELTDLHTETPDRSDTVPENHEPEPRPE